MSELRSAIGKRVKVWLHGANLDGPPWVEGIVVGYYNHPSIVIRTDDGREQAVSARLPRQVQEMAAGLGMSIERLYRSEESRALFVAWLRSPRAEAVLVAHQRTDTSGCHCGWGRLGHSHAAHVLAALAEEASRDR
jgi:hypothetical protein